MFHIAGNKQVNEDYNADEKVMKHLIKRKPSFLNHCFLVRHLFWAVDFLFSFILINDEDIF